MQKLWSQVDKKTVTRMTAGRWYRLLLPGASPVEQGVIAQAQLYTRALAASNTGVSVRFVRIFKDGRPNDETGYQDIARTSRKSTLNLVASWVGTMTDEFTLVVELRPNGGNLTLWTRIYKGEA